MAAADPNRPGRGSSPLVSNLARPPSPILAAPAASATSAPATGGHLGETSGITGHRPGQEYASVPSSGSIAFVSTDLRLDLGSVFPIDHVTKSSSAGQHMAFGYANSYDLSAPSHDFVQAQQQQSGRGPEAPRAGCSTRSRMSGSGSSFQLDLSLAVPAGASSSSSAAVADMGLATTPPPPPPSPSRAAAAATAGSPSPTTTGPGRHGGATPTTSSAQAQAQSINVTRDMWLACAAPKSGRLPSVGSLAYYFPDGHAEQCPSRPPEPLPGRIFLCKVTAVCLQATDLNEPSAIISLDPVVADDHAIELQAPADPGPAPAQNLISFVKSLTYTDAVKNPYRFIVPKKDAAVGVLPQLELNDNVLLRIKDLHGNELVFNYTWKKHAHMFLRGWRKFATANRLGTGDKVVLMRRIDNGEIFIGVRCTLNRMAPTSVDDVIDAVWKAARHEPFNVRYCSRQDGDEFVVPREIVDDGLRASFAPDMVVNFVWAVEEGKLPIIGPQGKVIAIENFATSIWRMIQVEWPSSVEMNRHVNFWQIRPVLGESSSQTTVGIEAVDDPESYKMETVLAPLLVNQKRDHTVPTDAHDSPAQHKNPVNAFQLHGETSQLQHSRSAPSAATEEPPRVRLFGQDMTPGVPPRRDTSGASGQVNSTLQ